MVLGKLIPSVCCTILSCYFQHSMAPINNTRKYCVLEPNGPITTTLADLLTLNLPAWPKSYNLGKQQVNSSYQLVGAVQKKKSQWALPFYKHNRCGAWGGFHIITFALEKKRIVVLERKKDVEQEIVYLLLLVLGFQIFETQKFVWLFNPESHLSMLRDFVRQISSAYIVQPEFLSYSGAEPVFRFGNYLY